MGKKIDISKLKDAAPARAEAAPPLGKLLVAAALFSILLAAFYLFHPKQADTAEQKIDIYLEDRNVMETSEVRLSVFSTCGEFSTFIDGKPLEGGVQSAKVSGRFPPGEHLFEAKNGNCSSSASFMVLRQECEDGQAQGCGEGKCNGTMRCHGGVWGSCELPKTVCSPGQKVGCSTDGCKFGYRTCNQCGSSFGECLPDGAVQDNTGGCAGDGCS